MCDAEHVVLHARKTSGIPSRQFGHARVVPVPTLTLANHYCVSCLYALPSVVWKSLATSKSWFPNAPSVPPLLQSSTTLPSLVSQARRKRKEYQEAGDSEQQKAYDDWIVAYEGAAVLQFPALDKLAYHHSRDAAQTVQSKGYDIPADQARSVTGKLAFIHQTDQEWNKWLDVCSTQILPGPWDASNPRLGQCSTDKVGCDPSRMSMGIQAMYVNSNFFNIVKTGADGVPVMHNMFRAFFARHEDKMCTPEGIAIMKPVVKVFKAFGELTDFKPENSKEPYTSSFEDVAYLCPWHEKFQDWRERPNCASDLKHGAVYSDYLRESKIYWNPVVNDYCQRMAAIHHRKPQLAKVSELLTGVLASLNSVKKEPGVLPDTKPAMDALQSYRDQIADHRKELGADRCKDVDGLASQPVETVAKKALTAERRDATKLRKLRDFSSILGLKVVSKNIGDAMVELEASDNLQALQEAAGRKPGNFQDVVLLMEAWQRAENIAKTDDVYKTFFPTFVNCLIVLVSNSRNRVMNKEMFAPVLKWTIAVGKNQRFVAVNDIGSDTDKHIEDLCKGIEKMVVATDAAKQSLVARKSTDGSFRVQLLEFHKHVKGVKEFKSKVLDKPPDTKLKQVYATTAKFFQTSIDGDDQAKGYNAIVAGWSGEVMKDHQAKLTRLEQPVMKDAAGANLPAGKNWYSGMKLAKGSVDEKALRGRFDKHLETLNGKDLDDAADALHQVRI